MAKRVKAERLMGILTRRSSKGGVFAVAVAGLAAASTGMALAADTVPSVKLKVCINDDEPWEMRATGINQNGDTVTETFSGKSCAILSKDGTEYWWALGTSIEMVMSGTPRQVLVLDNSVPEGSTVTFNTGRGRVEP
jgi:hypothetical protein